MSTGLFREFRKDTFKFGLYSHIPKALQDLVHYVNKEILIGVSPGTKWVIEAGDSLKLRFLQTGKLEHTISKFNRFSFTNDDHYLVYSYEDSLYALSLQTGKILTSVSGCTLYYFTRERQVGYWFRSDTEERVIFLTNLFSPFKFLSVYPVKNSVVGNSIAAIFLSIDTVMSVSPDSMVTLWQITTSADKEDITFVSGSSLSAFGLPKLSVKKCVTSPEGKLIAFHQGSMVQLYSFSESGVKFLDPVFESACEFTFACFAFSSDNTSLLFCIQDSKVYPHFYMWDVEKIVISASFKSPGLVTGECCCPSSSKRKLILCGEYQIEIWEYSKRPRLFTRLAVEKPSNNVKFSQCTVSLDNHLLACYIANTVIMYNLHASNINCSKRVLRGHLGRIEYCRFLKVNCYLISYGVDGMVFLWDLTEWKAVGFARITQAMDSIVSMAVSPEEDKAVCFTSSGRVCVIKLCELGSVLPLKSFTAQVKGGVGTAETSLPPLEQTTLASQIPTPPIEDDMAEAMSSSDSEGDFLDLLVRTRSLGRVRFRLIK